MGEDGDRGGVGGAEVTSLAGWVIGREGADGLGGGGSGGTGGRLRAERQGRAAERPQCQGKRYHTKLTVGERSKSTRDKQHRTTIPANIQSQRASEVK